MRRCEAAALLRASAEQAFAWLDDFHNLSGHMEKPSAMMLGSSMRVEADAAGGRAVGSKVRMIGRMLGMRLELEEVVVVREPPRRKAWETLEARLRVIGQYRLGFELSPRGEATHLRVWIEYALPERWPGLGRLLGPVYARWCVRRMAADAARRFAEPSA